jgi:ABC-type glutathione transport system ATPase component
MLETQRSEAEEGIKALGEAREGAEQIVDGYQQVADRAAELEEGRATWEEGVASLLEALEAQGMSASSLDEARAALEQAISQMEAQGAPEEQIAPLREALASVEELEAAGAQVAEGEEALQARTDEVLKEFSFTGDEEPFSLSRGQRQRVALASILAVEPEILILDEPTTGLDYLECCQVMDRIRRMNEEQQVTVIMVCHDMEVVLDYARRALVMAGGRLLADGPVREIFRDTELMEQASILPPQMIGLGLRLGAGFENADSPEDMAETVLTIRGKGAAQ